MLREPHIPLFLWIATALLVHLTGGGGASVVAGVIEDRVDVQRFANAVRQHVRRSTAPIEVALLTEDTPEQAPERAQTDPSATESDESAPQDESPLSPDRKQQQLDETHETPREDTPPKDPDKVPEKEREAEKLRPKPVEPAKPEAEKPKPEEKKTAPKEDEPEDPAKQIPTLQVPNRIAVRQHVQDEHQQDNPNAEFIADQANHVREQTRAKITSNDRDEAMPTPGSSAGGPAGEVGNAAVTDIAHSEDRPGEKDRAPNESNGGQKVAALSREAAGGSKGGLTDLSNVEVDRKAGASNGAEHGQPSPASSGPARTPREQIDATHAAAESPELLAGPQGIGSVLAASEARSARAAEQARRRRLPMPKGSSRSADLLGYGSGALTAGGINLNLSPTIAVATIGEDQLAHERRADGERRLSKHRGSWKTLGIERWRSAIENYNSSVKLGNQTALNTAKVPFASYLSEIHNRLHPIFADSFLPSLDQLPASDPVNQSDIYTNLEIVLDKEEGRLVKMGVTRASGSTIFDVGALEAVQSAQPFGPPPPAIVSPDGRVYLHWEFHRHPYYACSTYFARPFMLKPEQQTAPPRVAPPPPRPFSPEERGPTGPGRHGARQPPRLEEPGSSPAPLGPAPRHG